MRFDWYEVARQAASFQGVGADVRAYLHFKNVDTSFANENPDPPVLRSKVPCDIKGDLFGVECGPELSAKLIP
jgi:hypothetical protein